MSRVFRIALSARCWGMSDIGRGMACADAGSWFAIFSRSFDKSSLNCSWELTRP